MAEWNTSAWAFAHRVPYKGGGFTVGSSEPTGFPTLEGALDSVAELAEELDAEANRTRHGFIELHLAVVRKTMSERSLELVIDQQDAAGAVEAAEQFCKAAELLFGPDEEERLEYERKMLAKRERLEADSKKREEECRAPTVYRDHATGQDLPHQHLISWNTARQRPGTVVKLSPEPSVYVDGRKDEADVWIPGHDEAPLAEEFVIVSIESDGKLVTVKPKTQASRKKKGKTAPDD